jgi:Protein of unknown function (DUF3592)
MVLSSSIREEVAELLAASRTVLAVKLVREKAGVSLLEAKTIVEELAREPDVQLRLARPAGSPRSAGSGCLFALLFLLGFTGTGVGLLCGAAVFYAGQQELIARGQRTEGTVVELVYRKRGYAPVYRFELDGQVYRYHSNTSTSPPSVKVGDTVILWVDPADHERVQVDTFAERYLLIAILGPLGLLFTLIGFMPLATCLFRSS